jgi:hypothetical protein
MSADTLKTASAAQSATQRRGRRTTNGNAAQRPAEPARPEAAAEVDTGAEDAEDEPQDGASAPLTAAAAVEQEAADDAAVAAYRGNGVATAPVAGAVAERADAVAGAAAARAAAPKRGRPAKAASEPAELTDEDLLDLGKLTRFALEYGQTVEYMVERFEAMVAAYRKAQGL